MTGEEIIRIYDQMDADANNWRDIWQECADWAFPANDAVTTIHAAGSRKSAQRMIDTGIEAAFNLATGIFSHNFPPNTVWGKFRHPLPSVMEKQEVAEWYEEVSRSIHQILISSNFAQEEFQALLAIVVFGTSCISVEEDDNNIVRFSNYMVSDIRIQQNYLGMVDSVGREITFTPRQAIQKFGRDNLISADLESLVLDYDHSKGTDNNKDECKFIHYVAPREDFDPDKKDVGNKPFMSVYVSKKSKQKVKTKRNDSEEEGFDLNPYKVARFIVGNNEKYGRSPISMSLSRLRGLNVIRRSLYVSAEQHANPQWLVPDDGSVSGVSNRANAMIKWRLQNGEMGKPQRLPPNGDPGIAHQLFEMDDAAIKKMNFNDKFEPLEDYRNMTAFEANERVSSGLMKLTPFNSRYIDEHIRPLMHHVFYIAQKRNLLPEPPQALIDAGGDYEIDFVGRLALATKSFETLGAVSSVRVIGEAAQAYPELLTFFDNIDPDKFGREIWYSNSASMDVYRDEDEREQIRASRSQQMAEQQQMDDLPKMADAAHKMSGNPELINALAGEG